MLNKKMLTPVLLVLLAIGAYAVATFYFEVNVTGQIAMSIDEGESLLEIDCGTIFEGSTDVSCGTFFIRNARTEAKNVDIVMNVGNLGCHLTRVDGGGMTYANVAIPPGESIEYNVLATIEDMAPAEAGTCTITVQPSA